MRPEKQPVHYCDICHGIAPIVVKFPRDFFVAQAIVVAVALAVLLLAKWLGGSE